MADETQPDTVQAQTAAESVPAAPETPPVAPVDPSPAPEAVAAPEAAPAVARPVRVDSTTVRSDADALDGQFAKVVEGEHAGQVGVYSETLEYDPQTGYPSLVLLRFRDATYDHAEAKLPYSSIVPATNYNGGR